MGEVVTDTANVLPSLRRQYGLAVHHMLATADLAEGPLDLAGPVRGVQDGQRLADHLLRPVTVNPSAAGFQVVTSPPVVLPRMASSEDLTIAGRSSDSGKRGPSSSLSWATLPPYWPNAVPGGFPAMRHGINSHPELSLVTIHPTGFTRPDSPANSARPQSTSMIRPIKCFITT